MRSDVKKKKKFQMRVTLAEREDLRLSAAIAGLSVAEYIFGLHQARKRGEIMPGGARIIKAAMELAQAAEEAAKELSIAGRSNSHLRQMAVNLRSVISHEGRPLAPITKKRQSIQ